MNPLQKLVIDVKVNDLERAIVFYKDILGFALIEKADDWASFEVHGAEIHLYLLGGITHGLEFRVADIKKEVDHLTDRGVEFVIDKKQPHLLGFSGNVMIFPWGKTALFKDSENNELALIEGD